MRLLTLYLLLASCVWPQVITTVAGTGWLFPTTRTLPAVNAPLGSTSAVAVDAKGNVYIADADNNIVVRVTPDGVLTTVAGNGAAGFSGDGGPATNASLWLQNALALPNGLAIDVTGNLYIADTNNSRIRKVTPDGVIRTVAGNGYGFSGDGGPATSAKFSGPSGLAVDPSGNIYIADTQNSRIRKVTSTGTVSTFAGIGSVGSFNAGTSTGAGDGGPATSAVLVFPYGLALDTLGSLYIADWIDRRVRKITPDGIIRSIAGNRGTQLGDGGPATSAGLAGPIGVAVDATGNLYIADEGDPGLGSISPSDRIRRVTPDGTINTIAGNGSADLSGDGGPAFAASLYKPGGVAVDAAGALYIADTGNYRVRKITPNGIINTIAGNGDYHFSGDGGSARNAQLHSPASLTVDVTRNIYIADTANNRVRKIAANGTMSTVVGNGFPGHLDDDGVATSAQLRAPISVARDLSGNLYIADSPNYSNVRKVTPDGVIFTLFIGDSSYTSVAVDDAGSLYVASFRGIIKETPDGRQTVLSKLNETAVALDAAGTLYVADAVNNVVSKLGSNGALTVVAGIMAVSGFSGDGGPATSAQLRSPQDITFDSAGNLYIADYGNQRIRMVTPDGIIRTVAGTGKVGFSGDGGLASNAQLNGPSGVAVDSAGTIYIADTGNNSIRAVVATSTVSYNVSPSSMTFTATAGGTAPLPQTLGIASSIPGVSFTASSTAPWLTITNAIGSMPASMQVTADPSKLAAGTYQATITVTTPVVAPSTTTVMVTFTVQPSMPPVLEVNQQSLFLTTTQNAPAQTAQIQVRNNGGGSISYAAATSGGNWLTVSPSTGTATPGSPANLTVTATPGTLAAGSYQGLVTITGAGTSATVKVTLSISTPIPRILLSQSGLSFSAVAQGGAPLPQTFGILNIGQGSMDWSATTTTLSGGSAWLQISPTSGTVSRPFLDVSTVNVTVDPSRLAAGVYYGSVQVSARAPNSPQSLTVILTVSPAGTILGPEVRPAFLIFTDVSGMTPGSQDVLIGNLMPQTDNYISGQIGSGFTFLPTNAAVVMNQPATLRVFPDFSQLQPGSVNHGTITLQFSGGTERTISVLSVVAPTAISSLRLGPEATNTCASPKLEIQFRRPSPQPAFAAILGNPTTIEVQVVDDCGNLIAPVNPNDAAVHATFSNKDADLKLTHIGNGIWSGTWKPANPAAGPSTIAVTAFNSTGSVIQSGQSMVSGALTAGLTPTVTASGVVHAASNAAGVPIAPGSLITIYGSHLANQQGQSSTLPLPQQENGAQVLLGNLSLPILYTSDGQLNVQVPFNTPINGQYQLSVQRDNLLSVPEQLIIAAAQPGVFTVNQQGTGQGVIFHSDGVTLAQSGAPANVGETVVIYCTGLGAVTPAVAEGTAPPSTPLSTTVNPVTVTIGGINAPVQFSGLTPGFPGLYQVNAVVPPGASGDTAPLVLTTAGQSSPVVTLSVQ